MFLTSKRLENYLYKKSMALWMANWGFILLAITVSIASFQPSCAQRSLRQERLYEQGVDLLNGDRYEEALQVFNQCLQELPQDYEAYASRAEVRERLNDLSGAMIDYAICIDLRPDWFDPLFSLAVIRYKLKLYELAREDFLRLQTLPTGHTNKIIYRQTAQGTGTDKIMTVQGAIQSELYNYLGMIEIRLNNCREAIGYLDSAIQLNPAEADYYLNRALAKRACNDISADDDSRRALAINPTHSLTKHNMAVQSKENTYQQTEDQLTFIIQADSTLQYPFIARGYYRLTNGNYQGAVDDYSHALQIDDQDPHLWLNRGMAKEKLNDWMGAFGDYTHAIDLQENFANAWVNRANVLLKQKRFQDAIDDYTIAILHQPDYGYAYMNRALAKHYSKVFSDACTDLLQAEAFGVKIDKLLREEICNNK